MVSASAENKIIKFYTSWACPYAQRAWITLNHLNVRYDLIESFTIDKEKNTMTKDPNLLKINPKGLVPTLDVNGEIVVESIDIIEYLHNYTGNNNENPNFVTAELMEDAKLHDKISSLFYGVIRRTDENEREEVWKEFVTSLESFTEHIQPNGFFKSSTMNVVDISVFPIVIRLCLLERCRNKKLDETMSWVQKLNQWSERMMDNRAVSSTVADEKKLLDRLRYTMIRWGLDVWVDSESQ